MAKTSKISWTTSTWNPWIGCTEVSPDCDGCYAKRLDARWYGGIHWGAGAPRMHTSIKYWKDPIAWNEKAKKLGVFWPVFGGSMCDPFDNEVEDSWRTDYWKLILATPYLTWLILTKRVGNVMKMVPPAWRQQLPRNIWILMSTGDQELFDRDYPKLMQIPATIRGVSVEPMRGPVIFPAGASAWLRWAIYGGESWQHGHEPRLCKLEWIEAGIQNCRELGITPFVKQMGHYSEYQGKRVVFGRKGDDMQEWPMQFRVQEWPRLEAK